MKTFRYTIFAALAFAGLLPLGAQPANGITKQQADEILTELRQIRQLLEKQGRPGVQAAPQPADQITRAKLNLEGVAMIGNKDAPITIVEFTDYQCPFCQRFHVTTYAELKKNYIDTGKVRFYSRDLPLDFHANAMRAAQAARCAADQNQFWTLREVMSANPDKLSIDQIMGFATDLKMDVTKLRNCISDEKYKAAVQADVMEAVRIGANGTPAFVVGKSTQEGVDGELMLGAMPTAMFEEKMKAIQAGK
jgi:protein-disulfide isomerase